MHIKNPNDIVDTLVSDCRTVFGDNLLGLTLYGSALSHEFIPGKSDVNIIIILNDISITTIKNYSVIQNKWLKRDVAIPLFMTPSYIKASLDSYPIEFLNIQSSYRVLYGIDIFKECKINKQHLRLQCERELKGITIHLRTEFLRASGSKRKFKFILSLSMKKLVPLFRAILVLCDRKLPNSKPEVIAAIEDLFGFGSSVLSDILLEKKYIKDFEKLFDEFVKTIDLIIEYIDKQ